MMPTNHQGRAATLLLMAILSASCRGPGATVGEPTVAPPAVARDQGWALSDVAIADSTNIVFVGLMNRSNVSKLVCIESVQGTSNVDGTADAFEIVAIGGEDCAGSGLAFQMVAPRERVFARAEFALGIRLSAASSLSLNVTAAELTLAEATRPEARGRGFAVSWRGSTNDARRAFVALSTGAK